SLIMRIRTLIILASLFLAAPLFANETKIYSSYERVRQALLKNEVADVQKAANNLSSVARSEKQEPIAVQAETLAEATDVASARKVFAALSDEMIKFRAAGCCERPVVAYCSMEKKSWLQPKGPISNPYVAASMRACGEIKQQ
ncbi:MAG: DUF3347 domain-containing protein, partial [Thermoanaerobaculia bacterium]